MERLLLAVDIREDNHQLVASAADWAARLHARLDVAYVDAYRQALMYSNEPRIRALVVTEVARMMADDRRDLEALVEQIPEASRGKAMLLTGSPATAIAEEANAYDAVLVGSHGRSWLGNAVLGSVAGQILRHSKSPTLVLHGAPRPGPIRMLVSIDLNDPGPVLLTATAWATATGARVDLVYVEPNTLIPTTEPVLVQLIVEQNERRTTEHRVALERMLTELPEPNRGACIVVAGTPARALVDLSDSYELVVAGTHGRSGMTRLALGSVAERVARLAHSPVLLVPWR